MILFVIDNDEKRVFFVRGTRVGRKFVGLSINLAKLNVDTGFSSKAIETHERDKNSLNRSNCLPCTDIP